MAATELAHRLSSLDTHYSERIDLALARTGHGTAGRSGSAYSVAWARLIGR